jgi:hypothetical protein
MFACNLTQAPVIVDGNLLQCNGDNETDVSEFQVIDSSSINSVEITNANVTLFFNNVLVNTSSPVTIRSSTVRLVLEGPSSFSSSGPQSAALSCSENSNVTIQAVSDGSLSAIGNKVGIGALGGSSCGSVTILNGSVSTQGGVDSSGIGTGYSSNSASAVTNLVIMNGNITASRSGGGSGIGSGFTHQQSALTITSIVIMSGNITASSSGHG